MLSINCEFYYYFVKKSRFSNWFSYNNSAEAFQIAGVQQNANDMENQMFQKANSYEHYRQIVGKLLQAMHGK